MKFVRDDGEFDVDAYRFACQVTITAQEILVDNAGYPTPQIELNSHLFRPLGLGYANLGALLMSRGLAYDSSDGQAYAAALTAIMTGEAYAQSAKVARDHGGPFKEYKKNEQPFLRVIKKHRDAAYAIPASHAPAELIDAARSSWDSALELGTQHGYRNAQVTVLAPTGTIAFMMDCDTTGVEPDIALIKYKKLVGEGFLKIVNKTVPAALKKLGYSPTQVEEIVHYINERETIEGAPHLKAEHLSVFDCAFKPVNGERSIHYMGHVRMMGAIQPFLSGAISKTVNMPEAATPAEIADVYLEGWKLGLKAIAIYRDNSKRSQPLIDGQEEGQGSRVGAGRRGGRGARRRAEAVSAPLAGRASGGHAQVPGGGTRGLHHRRACIRTVSRARSSCSMAKEGSTVSGLMDSLATMTSISLQYGVPLRDLVNKFSHMRFEPAGFTGNSEIPIAKSIVDYVFRWMGSRFLAKDERDALGIINRDDAVVAEPPVSAGGFGAGLSFATPATSAATDTSAEKAHNSATGEAGEPNPPNAEAALPPQADASDGTDLPVLSNGHSANGHAANGHANGKDQAALPIKPLDLGGGPKVAFSVSADSPSCADCGSIMVRNGSCYKCLNCGSTSGCS